MVRYSTERCSSIILKRWTYCGLTWRGKTLHQLKTNLENYKRMCYKFLAKGWAGNSSGKNVHWCWGIDQYFVGTDPLSMHLSWKKKSWTPLHCHPRTLLKKSLHSEKIESKDQYMAQDFSLFTICVIQGKIKQHCFLWKTY